MPVQQCKIDGRMGWRWGRSGKCYVGDGAKAKAERQGRAVRASGYTENENGSEQNVNLVSVSTDADIVLVRGNGRKTLAGNTRAKVPNPLKADPTRTKMLRDRFVSEFRKRFRELKGRIRRLVVEEDAFGLKQQNRISNVTYNSEYSSTQVNLPELSDELKRIQSLLSSSDVLEVEDQPHVTVRYGLEPSVSAEDVSGVVRNTGIIHLKIGGLSLFQSEEQDVLKFDVESNSLRSLNQKLKILPHIDTYPGYHPHLTVAYLKPGTGAKYLDRYSTISGMEFVRTQLAFSTPDRVQTELTVNTRWRFRTDQQKVEEFRNWLEQQVGPLVLQADQASIEDAYYQAFVEAGYRTGAGRAFDDVRKPAIASGRELDFFDGTKQEFLRQSFARPETVEKVKLLTGRVFTDLKGVTDTMAAQMSRTLAEGLVQGLNPRDIARMLNDRVDKIGITRSTVIARTEIIRAHAEGQLDAMENLGMTEVGVMVEWSTAGDDRVCPLCQPMDGVVFTIKEARGLIPRHAQCRCAHIPANVGEPTTGQKKTRSRIRSAIKRSLKAEIPKGSRRSVATQRRLSSWVGAGKTISKKRPKSILDK